MCVCVCVCVCIYIYIFIIILSIYFCYGYIIKWILGDFFLPINMEEYMTKQWKKFSSIFSRADLEYAFSSRWFSRFKMNQNCKEPILYDLYHNNQKQHIEAKFPLAQKGSNHEDWE